MDQYAARFADELALMRAKAFRMRNAIGAMEGAMFGCDDLIDLKETWEDAGPATAEGHAPRDDLLLHPRLRWGELKHIFAVLDELNTIVNDDAFSPRHFATAAAENAGCNNS